MKTKKGISLIVLVITIIVMIILAAAVIISLTNSDLIDNANTAVKDTDIKQVEHIAAMAWSSAYIKKHKGDDSINLTDEVNKALVENGLNPDNYNINVTEKGVTVIEKTTTTTTLGSLITNPKEDYGKKVDYSVKVGDDTYSNWQIFYHNEEYVFLILDGKLPTDVALNKGTTVESLTAGDTNYLEIYEKFRVGDAEKYTLVDTVNSNTAYNSQAVAQLIIDYANFGDTTESYKEYVVGAIGGPTLELLAAGWNAKVGTPTFAITTTTTGYKVNNNTYINGLTSDELYIPADYNYWLSSPSAFSSSFVMYVGGGNLNHNFYHSANGVRPVVCLKSSIPATVGTGDYDFSLIK